MRNIYLLLIAICVTGCGGDNNHSQPGPNSNQEIVYINDGTIQCESSGLSAQETAQILINKGIDVTSSGCAYLSGIAVAAQCGLGDININIHTIPAQSLADAQTLGFESVTTLKRGDDPGYVVIECPEQD